jgi:hypothetical protein
LKASKSVRKQSESSKDSGHENEIKSAHFGSHCRMGTLRGRGGFTGSSEQMFLKGKVNLGRIIDNFALGLDLTPMFANNFHYVNGHNQRCYRWNDAHTNHEWQIDMQSIGEYGQCYTKMEGNC